MMAGVYSDFLLKPSFVIFLVAMLCVMGMAVSACSEDCWWNEVWCTIAQMVTLLWNSRLCDGAGEGASVMMDGMYGAEGQVQHDLKTLWTVDLHGHAVQASWKQGDPHYMCGIATVAKAAGMSNTSLINEVLECGQEAESRSASSKSINIKDVETR
jgi:hypothetical protein